MAKYICTICGYIYDESDGKWEDLSDDWVCPVCGAEKSDFEKRGESEPAKTEEKEQRAIVETTTDMREMTPLEISALCSNLAHGCEKQYKPVEEAQFKELAKYFKDLSVPAKDPDFDQLLTLIEKDLEENIPNAKTASIKDRGALRALTWNEKVTRILRSLLTRYQKQGDTMLQDTGVYVCTICGFIYIGDNPPDLCPVCKVPNWKFEKVEGR